MGRPFTILALNGGGVRGVFQATFIKYAQTILGSDSFSHFDLIAGTSTGSIVALALALDMSGEQIAKLYSDHLETIFAGRRLTYIRKGPRYSLASLKSVLTEYFGEQTLRQARHNVIVPATTLDRFGHRVFSNISGIGPVDGNMLATDVALASCAAPTFFSPYKPYRSDRTYLDGGLWANSPALLAILIAMTKLNILREDISVLSIGTGHFPEGRFGRDIEKLRPVSIGTLTTIPEMILSAQVSSADDYAEALLEAGNFVKIDVSLRHPIRLDDAKAALQILPALAEAEVHEKMAVLAPLLSNAKAIRLAHGTIAAPRYTSPPALIKNMIPAAGLSAFYPNRSFYKLRKGSSSIDEYVSTAHKSVVMVSINLMMGIPIDGLCAALIRKCLLNKEFTVCVSLLDPDLFHLMQSLAPALFTTPNVLASDIQIALQRLLTARAELAPDERRRFQVRAHKVIPMGSAILLDHAEPFGRVQIESKVYKAPSKESFGFEVVRTSTAGFYETLVKGYDDLVRDGREVSATSSSSNSTSSS